MANDVISAEAGVWRLRGDWIPAFAGMTRVARE